MLGAAFANVNVKHYDTTLKTMPSTPVQVNPVDLLAKVTAETQKNLYGSLPYDTISFFWSGQWNKVPKKDISSVFDPQAIANLQPSMTYWAPPRQDFHKLFSFSDLAFSFRLTNRIELITSYQEVNSL